MRLEQRLPRTFAIAGALLIACAWVAPSAAQTAAGSDTRTVRVAPTEGDYRTNAFHEFLLGANYRDLWSTPMDAPVLDLDTYAGGLTPVGRGGGLQTRSLRLTGADGVTYNFRSLDKDATRTLDAELRRSVAARVLQDQISALLPTSALVVTPLLDAAGVLHVDPELRVMPDDARLGEFREEFAGLVGLIEERPDEGADGAVGFGGSTRVTGSERLLQRLEEGPNHRVDPLAFLRARLLDVYVGDWDRHPDQWRWAEFESPSGSVWQPIPRDRDWALARMEGVLVWGAGFLWPHYHGFDDDYPSAFRATWSGRALDRRILSSLSWADWEAVTADLSARLTDAVIRDAVLAMPRSHRDLRGGELQAALRARRDALPAMARDYYDLLAGTVDLWATDRDEDATVQRLADGSVRVTYAVDGGSAYLDRTFSPEETSEVRLFLLGGDDRVRVLGAGTPRIVVRVVGGEADDRVQDETTGRGLAVYDNQGTNVFEVGPRARVDPSAYVEPQDPGSATHQARPRDWGSYVVPIPYLSLDSDLGLFVGAGFTRWTYGFRHFPYKTRLSASLGFGTASGKPRAVLDFDAPLLGHTLRAHIRARWSGAEVNRFYGRGNGTTAEGGEGRFKAEREQVSIEAFVTHAQAPGVTVGGGPVLRFHDLFGNPGRLVTELAPYGAEPAFGIFGMGGELAIDRRDVTAAATRGWYGRVRAELFPAVWDATRTFGSLSGEGAIYTTVEHRLQPTFAFRAGAKQIVGTAPYQELAYLGGLSSLRGFPNQRFAGDALVFANAEARVSFDELFILLPGTYGMHGLLDAGRVFDDADTAGDIHTAVGVGAWVAFVNRSGTLSLTVARGSDGNVSTYLKAGMLF